MNKFIASSLAITGALTLSSLAKEVKPPTSFTTSCAVCHAVDTVIVGPSLIEIAKLYPEEKQKEFIAWCYKPGRKRQNMPVMPAQTSVPEEQLKEIQAYIIAASAGKDIRVRSKKDLFKKSPTATARPRITRTFLPETGPASMIIALPTSAKHNFIWDTDKCELRYISAGKVDNYPYLKSNGNSLAKVGKTLITLSTLIESTEKRQFKGYSIDPQGFPTLQYTIGDAEYTEAYTASSNIITRVITSSKPLPAISKIAGNEKLEITAQSSEKSLTITYKSL